VLAGAGRALVNNFTTIDTVLQQCGWQLAAWTFLKIQTKRSTSDDSENGLKRPGARSRPTPGRLWSLVGIDAFTVALRRGNLRTISATIETENKGQWAAGAAAYGFG
jgi:hypothetical protein